MAGEQQGAAQEIDLGLGFFEFGQNGLRHGAAVQLALQLAQGGGLLFELRPYLTF